MMANKQQLFVIVVLYSFVALALSQPANRLGVAFVDEIRGITTPAVTINNVFVTTNVADSISTANIGPSGSNFQVAASGPVALKGTSTSISSSGALSVGSTNAFVVNGQQTSFSGSTVSVSSLNGNSISGNSVTLVANQGEILLSSSISSSFTSTNSISLQSENGPFNVQTTGPIDIKSQKFALLANAGPVSLGSATTDVHAAYDFWLRSANTFTANPSKLEVNSDNGEVIFESTGSMTVSSGSDLQFLSQQDLLVESLLGQVTVTAANLLDYRGYSVQFSANTIAASSTAGDVNIQSIGSTRFTGSTSVQFTAPNGVINGLNNVLFVAPSVTFSQSLTATAPILNIVTDVSSLGSNIALTAPSVAFTGTRTVLATALLQSTAPTTSLTGTSVTIDTPIVPLQTATTTIGGQLLTVGGASVAFKSGGSLQLTSPMQFTSSASTTITASQAYTSASSGLTSIGAAANLLFNAQSSTMSVSAGTTFSISTFTGAGTFSGGNVKLAATTASFTQSTSSILGGNVVAITAGTASGLVKILTTNQNRVTAADNLFVTAFGPTGTITGTATNDITITAKYVQALTGTTFTTTSPVLSTLSARDTLVSSVSSTALNSAKSLRVSSSGITGQSQTAAITSTGKVDFVGTSMTLTSASKIAIASGGSNTTMTAAKFITFQATNDPTDPIIFTSTASAALTAANDIWLQGGSVSVAAATTTGLISGNQGVSFNAATSSAFSSTGALSVNALNSIAVSSLGSTQVGSTTSTVAVTAPNVQVSTTNAGAVLTFDASTALTFAVAGKTSFSSDNFAGDAFQAATVAAPLISLTGNHSQILSGLDLAITAPTIAFNFPTAANFIGGFKGTTNNVLPVSVCAGDLEIHGSTFAITSQLNVTLQQASVCGVNGTTFSATANAQRGTLTTSAAFAVFQAANSLLVQGGEIGLTSTDALKGTIAITSPNALPFTSLGGQIGVDHGARADRISAPNALLTYLAPRAIQFSSTGVNGNDFFDDFGMLLSSAGDFNVYVNNGSLISNSRTGFRLATVTYSGTPLATGPQNINFQSTGDFFVNTTSGGFTAYAAGVSNANVEGLTNAGVSAYGTAGDIYIQSHRAGFSAEGYNGLSIQSLVGPVSFSASVDLDLTATVVNNGAINFFVTRNPARITSGQDTSLNAGSDSRDSDVLLRSFQHLSVTSRQTQRYHQIGTTTNGAQVGLEIISQYGDISVTSGGNIDINSAGNVDLKARVKDQLIVATSNVYLGSDNGRVNTNSSRTFTATSTAASIGINAGGGGGSVTILADSQQDVIVTASAGNIYATAELTSVITASQGILAVADAGNLQVNSGARTLFHSAGKIRIESLGRRTAPSDGAYFSGSNIDLKVASNALVDATTFTIGQTSTGSLASNPLVTINSGGSATVPGYTVTSVGGISLTSTLLESLLSFIGDVINIDAQRSVSFTTNGPSNFTNDGLNANGLVTFEAPAGQFHLLGNQGAIVNASSSVLSTSKASTLLQSTGTGGNDGFAIASARDFSIEAAYKYQVTVDRDLSYYGRDFQVQAASQVTIQNTPGSRGTLSFKSDGLTGVRSLGAMLLQTHGNGPISIHSQDTFSDVVLEAIDPILGSTLQISSSDAVTLQGLTAQVNGRSNITFSAPGAGTTIASSDATIMQGNNTLTVSSVKGFQLQTTDPDGAPISFTSSGSLLWSGATDVQISTQLYQSDIVFTSDASMLIDNFLNPTVRLRGSVSIESEGDTILRSRNNGVAITTLTDRIYIEPKQTSTLTAYGGISILSDSTQNNKIYLTSTQNAFKASSSYQLSFTAGTAAKPADITLTATGAVNWNINTAGSVGLDVHAGGAFSLIAAGSEVITGNYGVTTFSGQSTSVSSTTASFVADTSDVLVETQAGIIRMLSGATFTASATGSTSRAGAVNRNSGGIEIIAPNRITLKATTSVSIQSASETRLSGATSASFVASGSVSLAAGQRFVVSSSGRNTADTSGAFGVNLQADATVLVSAPVIQMNSEGGQVTWAAVENLNIGATTSASFFASDSIQIESGYEAANFAPFVLVPGIQFDTPSIDLTAADRDITVNSYDVSFSGTTVAFSSKSAGSGQFGLRSDRGTVSVVGGTIAVQSNEETTFTANAGTVSYAAATAVTVRSERGFSAKGNTVTLTATAGPVSISTAGDITLSGAFVDFQDDALINDSTQIGLANTQTLRLPQVAYQVDRQNEPANTLFLPFIENEVPGCVERQLGIDDIGLVLCVCDRNKWRCSNPNPA